MKLKSMIILFYKNLHCRTPFAQSINLIKLQVLGATVAPWSLLWSFNPEAACLSPDCISRISGLGVLMFLEWNTSSIKNKVRGIL